MVPAPLGPPCDGTLRHARPHRLARAISWEPQPASTLALGAIAGLVVSDVQAYRGGPASRIDAEAARCLERIDVEVRQPEVAIRRARSVSTDPRSTGSGIEVPGIGTRLVASVGGVRRPGTLLHPRHTVSVMTTDPPELEPRKAHRWFLAGAEVRLRLAAQPGLLIGRRCGLRRLGP
jgi:hypothetical protein